MILFPSYITVKYTHTQNIIDPYNHWLLLLLAHEDLNYVNKSANYY